MSQSRTKNTEGNDELRHHFQAINAWFQIHCNGEWEHRYGIKLETLDNPGWLLTIDLIHTNLQGASMDQLREGCAPDSHPVSPRWIHCTVQDNQFRGACDPTQLARLFGVFERFRRTDAKSDSAS